MASAYVAGPTGPDARITVCGTHVHLAIALINDEVDALYVFQRSLPVRFALLDDGFKLSEAMLDIFVTAKGCALERLFQNLCNLQFIEVVV